MHGPMKGVEDIKAFFDEKSDSSESDAQERKEAQIKRA
jgi:hypothetical protein